ncbi:MAG TPA: hypothetical protein VF666_08545 [Pyrinomonadaceae bacterium]|jgi:hypothetical protein
MKDFRFFGRILLPIIWALALGLPAPRPASAAVAGEKLKPEEVVSKHLDSIGAKEARDSVTSRVIVGTCKYSYRARGVGQTTGRVVLASEGEKSLIGMEFPEADYPHERLGFDGRKFSTGYIRPGTRTVFGDFLYGHSDVFREGLIGGTLNQAWPLANLAARNAKLEYAGGGKVNGKEVHVLRYLPKKGSDFQIKLYFDAATFQHVRSEYEQVISAGLGRTDKDSAGQRASSYKIVEDFSDHRKEGGLVLPHTYKIRFLADDRASAREMDWVIDFAQYGFNGQIPAGSFDVESFKTGS